MQFLSKFSTVAAICSKRDQFRPTLIKHPNYYHVQNDSHSVVIVTFAATKFCSLHMVKHIPYSCTVAVILKATAIYAMMVKGLAS